MFADRASEPHERFQAAAGQKSVEHLSASPVSFIAHARATLPPAACSAQAEEYLRR